MEKYEISGAERFWIGPHDEDKHLVYQMSSKTTEKEWFEVADGTQLDPNYSEFSVRIHNPNTKTLSAINNTMAVLPKSQLRTIRALIDAYLKEADDAS